MDSILVSGGKTLSGEITISGAKNSCLTLMPAALLTSEPLILKNVPNLSDIKTMNLLLGSLGSEIIHSPLKKEISIETKSISNHKAVYDIVRKMRASILVLGPLLAREGRAVVSLPGGCAIGARPVDLHLNGLEKMGAKLDLKDGYIYASVQGRLKGTTYEFPEISVGATENLIMAATLAQGTTVLKNAAQEPEIVDLCNCLSEMGGQIEQLGDGKIVIGGVDSLRGVTHQVLLDRIELGTYMLAPAIAGGSLFLKRGRRSLLEVFCTKLEEVGITVKEENHGLIVSRGSASLNPINVVTAPYPGFPTDLQAQMMALLTLVSGSSVLEETIFENRFMHAPELIRMGADINVQGGTATVKGVKKLRGAPVMATDLRASVSLVLAGLAAEGETVVSRVYHLDRGYELLEEKLLACGANIQRIST